MSTYNKTVWQDGDIITADKMNNIENGIYSYNEDLTQIEEEIADIDPGLSDAAKVALLNCFQHVAWIDEHGQDYYGALESALYADTYPKITAQFNSGVNVIYTDDTLDSLKQYLTVKYYETEEDAGTVIASANYALLGMLTEGASTVFVSYSELTTSFVIDGVVDFYNIWEWSMGDGRMEKVVGSVDPNQNDTTKYPSRCFYRADAPYRRNYNTYRGKAPFYLYNQTAQPSNYYPIPIPENANHIKVTILPSTQYVYINMVGYDELTNSYTNAYANQRITWNEGPGEVEKDIDRVIDDVEYRKMFVVLNSKYDNAGTSYPTEPTLVKITFSEV